MLPALLRKFHKAKQDGNSTVEIWGTGAPKREFLHVEDLASACFFLLQNYNEKELVYIGSGEDMSIKDLALAIKKVVGFEGELTFDTSKPDGAPRKLLSMDKLHGLGWKHQIELEAGIKRVYKNVLDNQLFL